MSENQQAPPVTEVQEGRGCCFYGCLVFILLAIITVVAGGLGLYWMYSGYLQEYTSEQPADLPTVEYTEEQLESLQGRVDTFKETLDKGDKPEDLVLTAEEINALIASKDELRGKMFVRIEDGKVNGEVSFPVDFLPGGGGRYFNASGEFEVELVSGHLFVYMQKAEINGEPVPEEVMQGIREQNLAKDIDNDPQLTPTLRRFDSLTIEGDTIILSAHAAEEPAGEDPAAADEKGDEESDGAPDDAVNQGSENDQTPSPEEESAGEDPAAPTSAEENQDEDEQTESADQSPDSAATQAS